MTLLAHAKDLSAALKDLPPANADRRARAAARQAQLTKPNGSLGRLEEIAVFLAGWQPGGIPAADRVQVIVFAGNHGVVRQGVSAFPADVTVQMVENFKRGGAAINALCNAFHLALTVIPLQLDTPTGDISLEPALNEKEALSAFNSGVASIEAGTHLVVFGEMGIGNTTIAATLCAAAFGGTGADWAGPGTGLGKDGVARKADIIDRALARHGAQDRSAFALLQSLGGRELCAMAGGIFAARQRHIPVLLDGFVVSAALAPLVKEAPSILDHCLAGHCSAEPAHRKLLEIFGLKPLLDLGMRLGEGTGAALATALIRGAAATHNNMATFAQAGVSDRDS